MTVSKILAHKGRQVITTSPDRSLRDIVTVLAERGIGAIVVTDGDRRVLGIVSERDLVRALAQRGSSALDEPVSNHMTTRVQTAVEDTAIPAAMEAMTNGRFRHLPVLDGGRLAGLVSIGDLVKYRLSEMEQENRALVDYITAV